MYSFSHLISSMLLLYHFLSFLSVFLIASWYDDILTFGNHMGLKTIRFDFFDEYEVLFAKFNAII